MTDLSIEFIITNSQISIIEWFLKENFGSYVDDDRFRPAIYSDFSLPLEARTYSIQYEGCNSGRLFIIPNGTNFFVKIKCIVAVEVDDNINPGNKRILESYAVKEDKCNDWAKIKKFAVDIFTQMKRRKIDIRLIQPEDLLGDHPQSKVSSSYSLEEEIQSSKLETYKELNDIKKMKKYYKNYNYETAKTIILAIYDSYQLYVLERGRWGPGIISRKCNFNPTTIGRYLNVFRNLGIVKVDGINLPIKTSHKNQ